MFGRDMANVAKKLKKLNMIEIRNAVDLNELAIRGMKRDDLELGRYDLDRLAITGLGKHYDVIRPEQPTSTAGGSARRRSRSVLLTPISACGGHSRGSVLRRRREE